MAISADTKAQEQVPETEKIDQRIPINYSWRRVQIGLTVTLMGFAIFLLGTRPGMFGLDRSPVIGFVQIAVFLVGLSIICIGGYISLMVLWKDKKSTIAADIGLRLVSTGYVIAVFAGMADVFGFGSNLLPEIPNFGEWQAFGVQIGEAIIAIGFFLLIPFRSSRAEAGHKI